ncbi:hypothetical protein LTR37_011720 [Vermiconidia calcicola]|uniref:Uncharacterized protein n=1 Tax=Vermiconidia calcicola TaxID=1690605 RepID=A0ACC3N303_9PEZI|nr:hypothetical protein LTR37_011720 [Vermiconidia calcicola]
MIWTTIALALLVVVGEADQSSMVPLSDIPRWCGKPYQKGFRNLPPHGVLHPPVASSDPMLFVQVKSRHSIYDSSEPTGECIVQASVSYTHGEPFNHTASIPLETLVFDIRVGDTDHLLLSATIDINARQQVFEFSFSALTPRLQPFPITLHGGPVGDSGHRNCTTNTELYYLPAKKSGSTVKIDNLRGGMLVANHNTNYTFEPFLPFGFYTSCSGYLNYSLANVLAYRDLGFNAVNPVCAFTDGDLEYLYDWLDEANLWYQYDMRGSYLNLSAVAEQIPLIEDRSAFLSWYTADEPDGWQHPLNATLSAYALLKEQDPYHPTGLVLNCDNYYFEQYSAGADYLMEDAYPIGINPIYSRPWDTICNETYGDCGCDSCVGGLQDISDRLDSYLDYQDWLGAWQKPIWAVLQAFSGEGYWDRDPTMKESWAMMLLSLNHGAKAIMSWLFPTTDPLSAAHAAFAKVATRAPVSSFLTSTQPTRIAPEGGSLLDVAYWGVEKQVMVGLSPFSYL